MGVVRGFRPFMGMLRELTKHRGMKAVPIAWKSLQARRYGVERITFVMLDLYRRSPAEWADTITYRTELEPLLRTINWSKGGKLLTIDKLITAERLERSSIPTAPNIAAIGRDLAAHPYAGSIPVLNSVHEIADLLRRAPHTLFVKPAGGWRAEGIMGPERRESRWELEGSLLSDEELASRLLQVAPDVGLLVQERVRSHPGLSQIGGELGLGTVRINTALTKDGPEVFFAFAKIMGSKCLVDNFSGGKFGNLLARLDKRTGVIGEVFGRKPGQTMLMEEVFDHPVTGTRLAGFQIPLWDDAVELAKRTAEACPEAPLIGMDVAITPDGPLIIELQSDWDARAAQLLIGRGLRPVLRELLPRLAVDPETCAAALALVEPEQRRVGPVPEVRSRTDAGPVA